MKIARHRIASALADQIGTLPTAKLSQEIAAYLLAERRTGELNSLMRDIMQDRADKGIVEVAAVTAYPLTPETLAAITREVKTAMPQAKSVIVSEQIDASVVGGVRLEFPNQRLDLSVRNKLNHFKQLTTGKV